MKAVIFAGGVGTRLWPLSRKKTPKQFEKIIDDKSTLQLTVERLRPDFSFEDIYIATGQQYGSLVKNQIPEIPQENIILEPEMRDVGPAVGLAVTVLSKTDPKAPFAILWSDHLIKNVELFKKVLKTASLELKSSPDKIIFLGQKPRFASQNLGWIEYGEKIKEKEGISFYQFKSWHYRPDLSSAAFYLKSGHHAWNPGYFVATPEFILKLYERFAPEIYRGLTKIKESLGKPQFPTVLKKVYSAFPKISFDNLILEQLAKDKAVVLLVDFGWSDVGAWEALKEALQKSPKENVVRGKVLTEATSDSLIYNYTDQLIAAIDVKGFLVVATPDAILICHKDSVPKVKKLVESLSGTEHEHLT